MTTPVNLPRARYFVLGVTLGVCALQLAMPNVLTIGYSWVGWPLLLAPLGIWAFLALREEAKWQSPGARRAMLALQIALVSGLLFNTAMLLTLLSPDTSPTALRLLTSAAAVIAMNVMIFGMIYWWNDTGGPQGRRSQSGTPRDLLFPQQQGEYHDANAGWLPRPFDYLYTAYTNVFAFSPTDTMPLSPRAKGAFAVQSIVALMTITVILGLAVNLLN